MKTPLLELEPITQEEFDALPNDAARLSLESSACSALTHESAEMTEKILGIEITKTLGKGWVLADLKGRVQLVKVQDEPQETFLLDGKPILQLWPVKLTPEIQDGTSVMTASRCYRTFTQNKDISK